MNGPGDFDLDLGLEVVARRSAGRTLLDVTLRLTNAGRVPVAPGVFASELLVDEASDPSWRLALNGPIEPELVELPPGRTAVLRREVGVGPLAPGTHRVQVRLGEQSTPVVEVEVVGAAE